MSHRSPRAQGFQLLFCVSNQSGIVGQFQERFRICDRFLVGTRLLVGKPTAAVGHSVVGLELDRLVVIGNGAVRITFAAVGGPATAVGLGVVGLELDRLVAIGDDAIVVTFAEVGDPTVVVGPARSPELIAASGSDRVGQSEKLALVTSMMMVAL
jgi:hypothetical protein